VGGAIWPGQKADRQRPMGKSQQARGTSGYETSENQGRTKMESWRSCTLLTQKTQKQSWNVNDNKSLLFLESPQSWNVHENKDSYAKKLECL
jgi:hypothetical protein